MYLAEGEVTVLSSGVQIALRTPAVLLGIAGVVLALVAVRRLGGLATTFAAVGSALIAADQIVNIAWVLVLTDMGHDSETPANDYNSVTNAFTVADAILLTIGAGLLIFAFFVRRPADRGPRPAFPPPGFTQAGFTQPGFTQPGFTQPGFAQPGFAQPGYPPPAGFPPPGYGQPPGPGEQPGPVQLPNDPPPPNWTAPAT